MQFHLVIFQELLFTLMSPAINCDQDKYGRLKRQAL